MNSIFKAYDVRGKVGPELNSEVVNKIARAFADWLPVEGTVAVGYDMRPDSKALADSMMDGLTEQGREVWNIGQVTSDMVYFAVGKYGLAGGLMITASHNPGDDNGIKFCREEAGAVGIETGLDKVRDGAAAELFRFVPHTGKIEKKDISDDWIEHVLSFINPEALEPYRIAIDAGNGMAGAVIPKLAGKVPFEITEMYFEPDGRFPNHIANPLIPENLEDLIKRIRKDKLDLGIAFDGDGDRAVLVDENGIVVSGSVMTAMLAEYLLKESDGGTILYNAICGQIVKETIEEHGGTAVRTRVGHSFIKAKMKEHNALFGGEHSGHYYFRDNWGADSGLIASVVVLAALSETGWKLSQFADKYRKYQSIPETNFEVNDKEGVMNMIAEAYKDNEQDRLDGLTVQLPNGWFNLRPSNTEPLLRFNVEAGSQEELEQITTKVKAAAGL